MDDVFQRPVSIDRQSRPFGDLTLAEVQGRAAELEDAVGWGPTARIRPVADAWRRLATAMEAESADTVRALGDTAASMGQALGVLPPSGGFLS